MTQRIFMTSIDKEPAACYQAAYTKGYQAGLTLLAGGGISCPYQKSFGSRAFKLCWWRGFEQSLKENK